MKKYQRLLIVFSLLLSGLSFGEPSGAVSPAASEKDRKTTLDFVWSQMQKMDKSGLVELAQQALLKCPSYSAGCESRACSAGGSYGFCQPNHGAKSCACVPHTRNGRIQPSDLPIRY